MSRLPTPGADAGNWGDILNDFLVQAHNPDGTLKVNSVGTNQIISNAVTNTQLASNSVTSAELANAAVQTTSLADSSVTTPKLADGSVTSAKIAPGVLTGMTVADGSVTTVKIADNAVTNVKLDAAIQASLANADSASQPGHTHAIADITDLQTTLDGKQAAGSYVSTSRTVAGHDLTADVIITSGDIGAATAAQGTKADTAVQPGSLATVATTGAYGDLTSQPTLGSAAGLNVGTTGGTIAAGDDARIIAAVPSTRTIAGRPLSADVVLTAADVGAATAAQGALAVSALQSGQMIATNRRVSGANMMIFSSRTFTGIALPPEITRSLLIVRNVGVNPMDALIFSTPYMNYNGTPWSGFATIQPGEEWVGAATGQLQLAPASDGVEIRALIWTEAYI